jgi:multidrug resistance protein, MATE family
LLNNNFTSLLKLAIPLSLTGLLQSSIFFFESLFLAHLGQNELAAGSLVGWLVGTFIVIVFGLLSSINILVAHKFGAKDTPGISLVVRDGILLALLLVPPAFLLFWNISPQLSLVGQTPAIVALSTTYLHAMAWGVLPNFIIIALQEIIIGLGLARIILVISLFSVSLNIFFSFVLIFGKFNFPALGIAGAGWGMTISHWVIVFFLMGYIFINKEIRHYFHQLLSITKPSYLRELIHVGAPMGIMYCVEVAFFLALTLIMGTFGTPLMVANQIAMQYLGTLMSIIFSIAQAITVRMGHLLGAGEKALAMSAAYMGVGLSGSLMIIVAFCYWLFPSALISVDFDVHQPQNFEVVQLAKQFFVVSAFFQIFESMRISFFGALRGLKDTHFTLLISIISFWGISLPLGYLMATRFNFGGAGLWWGMVCGASLSVVLLYRRFAFKIRHYSN